MNQTSHELQLAASVSGQGVKGALPAPGVRSGLDPLVSSLTPFASRFVDDQPAQHSGLGPVPTQNLLVTGGTFVSLSGGLCVNNFTIIVHRSRPRTILSIIYIVYNLPADTGEMQTKIRVPHKPNSSPLFTGRKDILDKLGNIFVHCANSRLVSRRSCLLWGMGGIGKTQISLKFIEEMSDR